MPMSLPNSLALMTLVPGLLLASISGCNSDAITASAATVPSSNPNAESGFDPSDPTPYDYDNPPPPGAETGTYIATFVGSAGGCFAVGTGTFKLLANPDGSGGRHLFRGTLALDKTFPQCASLGAQIAEGPAVIAGTYTYNGDGTLCEDLHIVGGPLDGEPAPALTYVSPDGSNIIPNFSDVRAHCPDVPAPGPAFAPLIGLGIGFRIGVFGDDPPGSGLLDF